jgi:hypothetical protein
MRALILATVKLFDYMTHCLVSSNKMISMLSTDENTKKNTMLHSCYIRLSIFDFGYIQLGIIQGTTKVYTDRMRGRRCI